MSSDFQNLSKSAMFKTMGYSPRLLFKIVNFRPLRIHPKSTQRVFEAVKMQFWGILEPLQRDWSDFKNWPKSAMFKTMAQGFCPKSANFRPLRIHRKSTQTVAQGVKNQFRRVLERFERVWSDFQNLSKSAMGYSPGLLLKSGQFSSLANSPEIDTSSRARS